MLHQPCCKKMLTRRLICLILGWAVLVLAIAEIQTHSRQGTTRFSRLQQLGWYGMVLKANR
jgi:preprotein translocase subunit Sec63